MTMVKREKFTTGTKDFTAQLLSITDVGAEIMVLHSPSPEDASVVMRQYR